ncbi:MAG: hypothetical protein LC737_11210, partial [Chloroflexi bacterium]|nr:hypothetical protein [Chloroflexota bacterium]
AQDARDTRDGDSSNRRVNADLHRMVGPTFRRSVAVSSFDPNTFRDLCLTNRDNIVRWIAAMQTSLSELSALVEAGDEKQLAALFDDADTMRRQVNRAYSDPDQESQAQAIRSTSGFGIGDLLLGRRRTPPQRGKADDKRGR